MTQEQLNEQLKDYCDKYSSFRYNDFHFPAGWSEEQMDVYRESRMEEYLSGIKELIQQEERNAVLSEVEREVEIYKEKSNCENYCQCGCA
ncbi:hypothetical protein, partial [Streptococcus pneumoniae]|uniref:hypothetical protein n=1 Tax=Streptococcus pneumoniae TaxID=1313 RepID=UPI001E3CB1E3